MNCKKCGHAVPEGGIFCPNCGARADGMKECPACSKLIDETATYCSFCGVRTDGKTVCENCGFAFKGDFCPQCGTHKKQTTQDAETKQPTSGTMTTYKKVENILAPTLALCALFVLFVCSFFIGTTVISAGYSETTNSFFQFGQSYKNITDVINTLSELSANDLQTLKFGLYFPAILATVAVSAAIIVTAIMLIVGAVKLYKTIKTGEETSLYKLTGASFAVFFGCAIYIYSTVATSVSSAGVQVVTKMSAGSLTGIILSGILLFLALTLRQIGKGKSFIAAFNLKKIISCCATVIAVIITLSLCGKYFLSITETESSTTASATVSVPLLFRTIYLAIPSAVSSSSTVDLAKFNGLLVLTVINFIVYILLLVTLSLVLYKTIRECFSERTNPIGGLVFSIIASVFSTVLLVTSLISASMLSGISTTQYVPVTTDVIGFLITTFLTLGGAITYSVLTKKRGNG